MGQHNDPEDPSEMVQGSSLMTARPNLPHGDLNTMDVLLCSEAMIQDPYRYDWQVLLLLEKTPQHPSLPRMIDVQVPGLIQHPLVQNQSGGDDHECSAR